jgi:hypothetical protein
MNTEQIKSEVKAKAFAAADNYFKTVLGGVDRYACGFAWVTVEPEHKGNTRLGRVERATLAALGLRKDWTGKTYELWNPAGYSVQNVDTLYAGAAAAALVLRGYGFRASAQSRLD